MNTPTTKAGAGFLVAFACLVLLEICFNLYFNQGLLGQAACSAGLFLVSLLSGLSVLWYYYNKKMVAVKTGSPRMSAAGMALLLAGGIFLAIRLSRIFREVPIDARISDIIPLIQALVKRFMTGAPVYTPVEDFGYTLHPNYLPMHWLPYCLSYMSRTDPRWVALGINALAGLWLISRNKGQVNPYLSLLVPLLLIFNWLMILFNIDGIYSTTIEIMVAGYYMLFIGGLNGRSAILKGLFISFCLMSRFSLVLWLPLWLFTEWAGGNRKQLLVTIGTIAAFVLAIYVVPFLSKDWGMFFRGYQYYTTSAIGEWNHLNEAGRPYHLYAGSGFGYLFYEKLDSYTIPDRIKSLQKVHMLACLGAAFIMGAWYWFKRKHIHKNIFLMGSFKIYLTFFLAFIQVPYSYLMITGTFVSIAILASLMRYRVAQEHEEAGSMVAL